MTNLLSEDPGYAKSGKGCACALYLDDHLDSHWFERPEDFCVRGIASHLPHSTRLDVVLWEKPQGDARTWHIPPAVMIELTAAGASLAGLYAGAAGAKLITQTPTQSKGSNPKPICHARLWEALTPQERSTLGGDATWAQIDAACERGALARWAPGKTYYPASWLTHNILDAVALGAKYLGRY